MDILLNIPSILIGIRNALLPIQPYIRPPVPASATARTRSGPSTPGSEALALRKQITAAADESSLSETESVSAREMEPPRRAEIVSDVETGSEADVESNTEHDSGAEGTGREGAEHATGMNSMTSSWVNLTS